MRRRPLSDEAIRELEASGLEWHVARGGKHMKLYIQGRMVQTLTRSARVSWHGDRNVLASIRRAIREALERR